MQGARFVTPAPELITQEALSQVLADSVTQPPRSCVPMVTSPCVCTVWLQFMDRSHYTYQHLETHCQATKHRDDYSAHFSSNFYRITLTTTSDSWCLPCLWTTYLSLRLTPWCHCLVCPSQTVSLPQSDTCMCGTSSQAGF